MTEHTEFKDVALALTEREALARAETVPSAWFTEARFDRLDREAVLGTSWQYVGHAGRLARPGSWLAAEVAGEPVVVVRDLAGDLRAFFNVCRHRGGPLALADGCGRVLKCQYHGWTYLLDGSLRGVPHWNLVELFDREDFGLVPLRVDTWDGLLFVNLDQRGPSIGEVFATVSETIAPIRLGEMTFHERVVYDVKANWKVYVENYLEGYHVPIVHPELMKLYDFSSYETEISDHWSLQPRPWPRASPGWPRAPRRPRNGCSPVRVCAAAPTSSGPSGPSRWAGCARCWQPSAADGGGCCSPAPDARSWKAGRAAGSRAIREAP